MDESSECLAHLVGIAQQPKTREKSQTWNKIGTVPTEPGNDTDDKELSHTYYFA